MKHSDVVFPLPHLPCGIPEPTTLRPVMCWCLLYPACFGLGQFADLL